MERDQGDQVTNAQVSGAAGVLDDMSGEGSSDENLDKSLRPGPKGDRLHSAKLRDRIVELALSGRSNTEIAEELGVTRQWVWEVLGGVRKRARRMAQARTFHRIRRAEAGLN